MRIICNDKDLTLLELHCAMSPNQLWALRANLEQSLSWICEALPNEASLEEHGPLFFLEPGDNTRGMVLAGIPSRIGGLLGVIPEYVEEVTIDSKLFWKALVVIGNSYAPTYWIPVGMDSELDQHLSKYLDQNSEQSKPQLDTQPDGAAAHGDWSRKGEESF